MICTRLSVKKSAFGKLSGKPDQMLGGNLAIDKHPIGGGRGVVILLVASHEGNQFKLWLVGPLGLSTDLP